MIAAAATRGDVLIDNVIPKHLEALTAKLLEMGVGIEELDESIRVIGKPSITMWTLRHLYILVSQLIYSHQ